MGTVDFRFPENLHVFQDEVEGNFEIQLDCYIAKQMDHYIRKQMDKTNHFDK